MTVSRVWLKTTPLSPLTPSQGQVAGQRPAILAVEAAGFGRVRSQTSFPTRAHAQESRVGDLTDLTRPPLGLPSDVRAILEKLAERVRRLLPDRHHPEQFHEEKSEVVFELRRLAKGLR